MTVATSQKSEKPLGTKRGFTLIELLVVIAIIATLTAILIPSLRRARRQAKKVACHANLKQWALIFDMYTNDNNNYFFKGLEGDWIEILKPLYGERGGLTCCPAATRTLEKGGRGVFAAWENDEGDYGSYGLNAWVRDADTGDAIGDELYWRKTDVAGAENIPVLLDSISVAGRPDSASIPPEYNGQLAMLPASAEQTASFCIGPPPGDGDPNEQFGLTEQMKNFCINRHGHGTTNCLFMDHSVRAVGLKELWKLKWHRKFDVNGSWTGNYNPPPVWPDWMKKFKNY